MGMIVFSREVPVLFFGGGREFAKGFKNSEKSRRTLKNMEKVVDFYSPMRHTTSPIPTPWI